MTGGTGFIGSHILAQLLETDYIIRAYVQSTLPFFFCFLDLTVSSTARSVNKLRSAFPDALPSKLQIIEMPDLESDHTEALRDVDALIHCAAPSFVQCQDNKDILSVCLSLLHSPLAGLSLPTGCLPLYSRHHHNRHQTRRP